MCVQWFGLRYVVQELDLRILHSLTRAGPTYTHKVFIEQCKLVDINIKILTPFRSKCLET